MEDTDSKQWLTSKEARKALKVSGCTLSHIRQAGRLRFEKRGNAYYYLAQDVERQVSRLDKY